MCIFPSANLNQREGQLWSFVARRTLIPPLHLRDVTSLRETIGRRTPPIPTKLRSLAPHPTAPTARSSHPSLPLRSPLCALAYRSQERRDAALRGQFTVKRRPQQGGAAAGGAHPLSEAGRKGSGGGMFDRKPKVVLDPLAVRPLLNVASLPSRKPVGVYGRERR